MALSAAPGTAWAVMTRANTGVSLNESANVPRCIIDRLVTSKRLDRVTPPIRARAKSASDRPAARPQRLKARMLPGAHGEVLKIRHGWLDCFLFRAGALAVRGAGLLPAGLTVGLEGMPGLT